MAFTISFLSRDSLLLCCSGPVYLFNLFRKQVSGIFSLELHRRREYTQIFKLLGYQHKVSFDLFKRIEIRIFSLDSNLSLDFFENLRVLDAIFVGVLVLPNAVLLTVLFNLIGVGIDDCYHMVLHRITVQEHLGHEFRLLIGSLEFLRDDVLALTKLENVLDTIYDPEFVLLHSAANITCM